MAGKVWLAQEQLQTALKTEVGTPQDSRAQPFTGREQQVLSCVFEGLANKEIAARIGVSESSDSHTSAALFEDWSPDAQSISAHRLGATSESALVRQAARGSGMARRELRRSVLPLVLLTTVVLAATAYAHGSAPPSSSSEGQQVGKILSVRKVLGTRYFVPRYPQIHYYLLYFAIRVFDQTYCSEYETPVLDEIDDLFSAKDKDVELVLKGKNLTLRTPHGRKIKAHLVDEKHC